MAKEQKGTNLYLMSIVAIVAIVGIVILVLNVGGSGMMISSSENNAAGQAYSASSEAQWTDCGNGEMVRGDVPCSVSDSSNDLSGQAIASIKDPHITGESTSNGMSTTSGEYDPCGKKGGHCCDSNCKAWCCN